MVLLKRLKGVRTVFLNGQPADSIGRRVTCDKNAVFTTRLATRLWTFLAGAYFCHCFSMISKDVLIVLEESMSAL